jgi:hypothetical protein
MVDYFENSLLISNLGVRRNLGTLSAFAQLIVRNLILCTRYSTGNRRPLNLVEPTRRAVWNCQTSSVLLDSFPEKARD